MHQYLFFIGDFPIRAYGLILSLSIILATGVAYFLAKQDGRYHGHIIDMGIYCGIAGLLGARLWDVFFFDWNYYQNHLSEILNVWQGGMAIQGGIFLGAVIGIIYTYHHKIDTWALADIVAPAIILGQAIGRCANLMNGDLQALPLEYSIRKALSRSSRMATSPCGQRKFGKDNWILSSSPCS